MYVYFSAFLNQKQRKPKNALTTFLWAGYTVSLSSIKSLLAFYKQLYHFS